MYIRKMQTREVNPDEDTYFACKFRFVIKSPVKSALKP